MVKAQKIIKYFAIGFAFLLIVSIFSFIIRICANIFGVSFNDDNDLETVEILNNINSLEIDLKDSKLTIKNGDVFKIEVPERVKLIEKDNKIKIKENNSFFNNSANSEVYVYLPTQYILNDIVIDSEVGNIVIDGLNAKKLDLNLDVGKIDINKLNVLEKSVINCGFGNINIIDSIINNLKLDIDVGKVNVNGNITGDSDIAAGIGLLTINLNNSINNYYLDIEKGIGKIIINDEKIKNNYIATLGNDKLEINDGIGSIIINTLN